MKTILFTALAITAFIASCKQVPENNKTRIVYDAGDQHVISHAVNKQLETMSILYGNKTAYDAALSGNGSHQAGERYTFVTWRYHDNPMWYGSKINGELLSVEKLEVSAADGAIRYHVEEGNPPPVNGHIQDSTARIRYLLEFRPSMMP